MRSLPGDPRHTQEEFEDLFRRSMAVRMDSVLEDLWEDPEFLADVREQFEKGRLQGHYPALSRATANLSDEEKNVFLVSGWFRVLHTLKPPEKQPWDSTAFGGNMYSYREELYSRMAWSYHDQLPDFAEEWLRELVRVGYRGMRPYRFHNPIEMIWPVPTKQQPDHRETAIPKNLAMSEEAYAVVPEGSRQVLWLQLDGSRSLKKGYRDVRVSDRPIRTDVAILAALTALEGQPIDVEALREHLTGSGISLDKPLYLQAFSNDEPEWFRNYGTLAFLDYVLLLLRHHRPDFRFLSSEEKIGLLVHTCAHVKEFLDALGKLTSFLEYGNPTGRKRAAVRDADRDVKAAVLRDVDGLTYREIGSELGVPTPKDFAIKGDHPRVRQMVSRGRNILELSIGTEGWKEHIEVMKAEARRWNALSEMEKEAEYLMEERGLSYDEALRIAREETRDWKQTSKPENE